MNDLTLNVSLVIYAFFLLVVFIINMLYFYQVFQHRLKGDATFKVMTVYISLIVGVLFMTGFIIAS